MPRFRQLIPGLVVILGLSLSSCGAEPTAEPSATTSPDASYLPEPSEGDLDAPIAEDGLAVAFPRSIIPILPDAEIALSTAEQQGTGQVEFSLVMRTNQAADEILAFYRESFVAAQFAELTVEPTEGITAQGKFTRSQTSELVDIAIRNTVGEQTVSIGGQVVVPPA